MTDGRQEIAGSDWEQLQPLLFSLGNQMGGMRNSQPSCTGKAKCLCCDAAVICQGREFVILTDMNSEIMNLGLLFFSDIKEGIGGKERE